MAERISAAAASREKAFMVEIFALGDVYVNSLRRLFLELGEEVRPELLHDTLVADSELDRLELPPVGVVHDLLALLGVAVGARLVRLVPVAGQPQQVVRLGEV